LDTSEFNSRGLLVIGAAVVVTVILLAAVPKHGPLGGVKSGGSVSIATVTTFPSSTTLVPVTTAGGSTSTTKAPTATTKKSSTATTTAPTTTVNPNSRPKLQLGSTGPDVTTLQQKLIALGLLTGTADGNFGTGTQAAVIKFQQSKNLPADGVVGASTWAALG
jgi:hypothetical protein